MKKTGIWLLLGLLLCLQVGCAEKRPPFPAPAALYAEVEAAAALPEMISVDGDYLLAVTGIDPEAEESFVYALPTDLGPEEVLLVLAVDEGAAEEIQKKLETRLEDRRTDAERYMTEYLPILQKAEVRRDGLLVSLLIAEDMEAVRAVYDKYQ